VTFDWALVEKSPGVYNFTFYDDLIEQAARRNIEVLPVLFNPPSFRSSRPRRKAKRGTYFPRNLADLGTFGAAVVRRYGPNGTFWLGNPAPRTPVVAVQVWNEPNLPVYDPSGPSPKHYARLLKAAYGPIKAADPSIEVVTAGLPDSHLSKPNVFNFVDQLYKAGGGSGFDTLAVNPYASTTKQLLSKLAKFRKIMKKHHDSAAKLWITEMGWADKGPRSLFTVGRAGQASRIRSSVPALAKAAGKFNLRGFIYYAWRDGKPYAPKFVNFWGLHTGLLNINGSPKPAYTAFKQAIAGLPH
jgi:polysaccharide biosynthesis protein PslG